MNYALAAHQHRKNMMQTQAVIRHISRWLAEYAVRAGAKGFVVG